MLYDLADPMARHVTDTTQTEPDLTNHTAPAATTTTNTQQPSSMYTNNTQTNYAIDENGEKLSSKSSRNAKINDNNNQPSNIVTHERNPNNNSDPDIDVRMGEMHSNRKHSNDAKQMMYAQTMHSNTVVDSPTVEDITKNGHYHRSDNIDFVQMRNLPQAEQPVFERVLLPEKKRPTFNKIAQPHEHALVQTVNHTTMHHSPPFATHSADDFVDNYHPSDYSNYQQTNYNQNSQYAIAQRHQPLSSHHLQHQQQQQQQTYHQQPKLVQSNYAQLPSVSVDNVPHTVYKTNRNYANDHFDENLVSNSSSMSQQQPRYIIKNMNHHRQHHNTDINRNRDPPNQYGMHQSSSQQPMMVIRNYAQPSSSSARHSSTTAPHDNNNYDRKNVSLPSSSNFANNNYNQIHRHGASKNQNLNKSQLTRKNNTSECNSGRNKQMQQNCCSDDDDGDVDYRKMNPAIRPGFVAAAAAKWDRRATENSNELNTIV